MDRTDYILRAATLADAERIFALIHLHRHDLVPRPMGDIVENIDRFTVAEAGGEMVGCAAYKVLPEIGAPFAFGGRTYYVNTAEMSCDAEDTATVRLTGRTMKTN